MIARRALPFLAALPAAMSPALPRPGAGHPAPRHAAPGLDTADPYRHSGSSTMQQT